MASWKDFLKGGEKGSAKDPLLLKTVFMAALLLCVGYAIYYFYITYKLMMQ